MKIITTMLASLALSLAQTPAHAGSDKPTILASLQVRGTISVSPQGDVTGYAMDRPENLPRVVVQILNRQIPHWRFRPVSYDGKPAAARARMYIRMVARPLPGKRYAISVASTAFAPMKQPTDGQQVHLDRRHRPPTYPRQAVEAHVQGTVYLLFAIDQQGHVVHVASRQVDLKVLGNSHQMQAWRTLMSKATLRAARHWQFSPPGHCTGDAVAPVCSFATVPVSYRIGGPLTKAQTKQWQADQYGKWDPFVPGPVEYIPWASKQALANISTAQPDGSVQQPGSGLQRITGKGG